MAYKFRIGKALLSGAMNTDDIAYYDDPDTLIDWEDDYISFKTNNTSVLTVSGSKVGIGTTTPARTLTVEGEISASSAIYGTDLVLKTNAGSGIATIYIEGTNGTEVVGLSGGAMNIRSDGGDLNLLGGLGNALRFGTDNVDGKMVMDTAGNVGIGDTSPDYTLDVAGDMGINDYIYHNEDANTYIGFPSVNKVNLVANGHSFLKYDGDILINNANRDRDTKIMADDGNVVLHVDAGDNRVGIGTTSPTSTLHIAGSQGGNYTAVSTAGASALTLDDTHYIVNYTGDGDAVFTLPDVSGITGRQYHILHNCQGHDNVLTVTGSGGKFLGAHLESPQDSVNISGNQPQGISVVSTGTNWFILHDGRSEE